MHQLYSKLVQRSEELVGYRATPEDVALLSASVRTAAVGPLLSVYHDLDVCGMRVQFEVDQHKQAYAPAQTFASPYDSLRHHEFYWLSPQQIMKELAYSCLGAVSLTIGFVPIGYCTFGGDDYYVKLGSEDELGLYQLYHDWIDPRKEVAVPAEAVNLVAFSLCQVIGIARFAPGIPRANSDPASQH